MRVLVIGGKGIIGKAVVEQLSKNHEVLGAGRTSKLYPIDITSPKAIRGLFDATPDLDAVVCTAGLGPGDGAFKPLDKLTDEDFALGLNNKLMGQVNVVRIGTPYLRDNGSFTLTSGMTGRQPIPGATSYAMVNAAIEGFVRAAALELPRGIRINVVSPQWTRPTLKLYGMNPDWGVHPERVALGYEESIDETHTGTVIDAGWKHDWARKSVSVAAT